MTRTLAAACQYLHAGFSLIPLKADGSKAPALAAWKVYQTRCPTETELDDWFGMDTPRGIGLIHGAVSGHSEALDFDQPGLYEQFADLCIPQGLGDLLDALPLVQTPSGGRHLLYRCQEPVSGNQKLAETPERKTLIETRGEGGYTVAPGSAASCHPAGTPYQFLRGHPGTLPTITASDRAALLNTARLLNECADPAQLVHAPRSRSPDAVAGLRPGDDYNGRGDWPALLERHGWQHFGTSGDKGLWQRPGKQGRGLSATSNYAGSGLFYVFSANAPPFAPLRAYAPFSLYALLEHSGDYAAAAGQLAQDGYGQSFVYSSGDDRPGEPMPSQHPAALPAVPRSLPTPPRKPLADRMVDLADVEPPGDLPLLFGPYLLQGHSHWLTGQTGLGKSTLLYNIACALAEGKPLWGFDLEPTRVLYADMENGDVGRAHKVDRLYGSRPRVRNQLLFLREPIKLPEELPELLAYVQAQQIGLVIFDTARRCFTVKDENDNAEVYTRVVPTIDGLKQLGIASLTLGHPSKNGNGSARGAGAQEDAGDVNLSLTMHRGEIGDKDGVVALRVTKNRLLGLGVDPLYLRRIGEDQFERADAGEISEAIEEPQSKRELCQAALLDFLAEQPNVHASYTVLINAMKAQGYTEATARRAKDVLETEGKLLRAIGGGYCLPDPFAEGED